MTKQFGEPGSLEDSGIMFAIDRIEAENYSTDLFLRCKQFADLRGIAATLSGLQITAYPSAMPLLVQMGLVEERPVPAARHREGRGWFLTALGRETIRVYGVDEA